MRRRLIALSEEFDEFPQQLERIQAVTKDHDLERICKRIDRARESEGEKAPDDLGEELHKLQRKLQRLERGDDETYEYKFPTRKQIPLEFLISILIEILDILRKLYERSNRRVEG
ncbi:MAG: hypothetical protein ACE5GX_19405 [Thermoanaerobaculia bacterium]